MSDALISEFLDERPSTHHTAIRIQEVGTYCGEIFHETRMLLWTGFMSAVCCCEMVL